MTHMAERGPFVITDALGSLFRPEAWSRAELRSRCAAAPGAPPPAPPWPTIAYRQPASVGTKWAGLKFENGAALGVRDADLVSHSYSDLIRSMTVSPKAGGASPSA